MSRKVRNLPVFLEGGLILFLGVFLFASCASFAQKTHKFRASMESGGYDRALLELEQNGDINNDKNRVLYLLDKGMILHLAGRYEESNKVFELAERQSEEYWATSVSEEVASMLTSDDIKAYPGEDFERVLILIYRAMNYLAMDSLEDALVECRQVDIKLNEINQKYGKNKNVYREDAFARWLSGIIYEAEGDFNNAVISYRKAIGIYKKDYLPNYRTNIPAQLIKDYLGALKAEGLSDELERAKRAYLQFGEAEPPPKDMGEVVLIYQNGRSPHKIEQFLIIPVDNTVIKLAFPEYRRSHYFLRNIRIRSGDFSAQGELAEDITEIAIKNLKDRAGRTMLKMAARAATKVALKKAADKAHPLLGLLTNVANVATEKADTRSWLSLPAEFNITRLQLPPGERELTIEYLGGGGAVYMSQKIKVKIEAGKKVFITRRTWN
ncbi:MAG: hypothetical protein Kow0090_17320 [Myxococcota bacterium]